MIRNLIQTKVNKGVDFCTQNLREKLDQIKKGVDECRYGNIFSSYITNHSWLQDNSFAPSGAAANYSFLYILLKILDIISPSSILELGMGETSKITSQYAFHTGKKLLLVEDSPVWIDLVWKKNLSKYRCSNINMVESKTKNVSMSDFFPDYSDYLKLLQKYFFIDKKLFAKSINYIAANSAYSYLLEDKFTEKFDLIINDGPMGSLHVSRTSILSLIPNNLKNDFVILIDDFDRIGEKEMAVLVMRKLNSCGISFDTAVYSGSKQQLIIYSLNFSFLKTL